jgi:hypothetical protein
MNIMNYPGLDIRHTQKEHQLLRAPSGWHHIVQESTITATRQALDEWMRRLPQPWMAGTDGGTLYSPLDDHYDQLGL